MSRLRFGGITPISLPIIATAAYRVTGPGNIISLITTQAGASVEVIYTYVPVGNGATRTPGYWKTHLKAMQMALDRGCIDLGYLQTGPAPNGAQDLTDPTIGDVMAIFWASDTQREAARSTKLGQTRMKLANHLLAAMANACLLGTTTQQLGFSPTLLEDARAALDGTDISLMLVFMGQLDTFNNSGTGVPFDANQEEIAGPADPQGARAAANRDSLGRIDPGPAFR